MFFFGLKNLRCKRFLVQISFVLKKKKMLKKLVFQKNLKVKKVFFWKKVFLYFYFIVFFSSSFTREQRGIDHRLCKMFNYSYFPFFFTNLWNILPQKCVVLILIFIKNSFTKSISLLTLSFTPKVQNLEKAF